MIKARQKVWGNKFVDIHLDSISIAVQEFHELVTVPL